MWQCFDNELLICNEAIGIHLELRIFMKQSFRYAMSHNLYPGIKIPGCFILWFIVEINECKMALLSILIFELDKCMQ